MLDYSIIKDLYAFYEGVQSLQKTTEYGNKKHGLTLNRHQLSRVFKSHDLYVKPPNGQPERYWQDLRAYNSPVSHLCAAMLDSVFADLISTTGAYIDYITACAFVGTPRYLAMLGTLINVSSIKFDETTPIPGVDIQDVLLMRTIYDEAYYYWVAGLGD